MTSTDSEPHLAEAVGRVAQLLRGKSVAVLTGAGLSTDSGIPDYRGPGSGNRTPMFFQEFIKTDLNRQRYWARSYLGFGTMDHAEPNDGHRALVSMERAGLLAGLITQNVDGLHTRAGSVDPIDLHGRIDRVVCLAQGHLTDRARVQARLAELNPGFAEGKNVEVAPDGDTVLEETSDFRVVACEECGGILKPDVVFFGESVPLPRVQQALAMVAAASALLVAGSSLTVFSGYRFVRLAARENIPIVIINRGSTRGDDLATIKLETGTTQTLQALTQRLTTAQ
ncbi:NAD-dependent protein deacetylase [Nakamurella antarctica]|uniref:protein acetyllysine N-acetyltransferase n=1 Tax=Nakamurella antarctica TaxID=1902245 RepID=A0A3G8ZJQ6_9ACTN|nr:NAD-dependent protein deacetylase [Nakamurella antarctica]AZI57007.1 NAD-dependent protein deacetylase [Nakamurella antarctica]